ncbi:MAG: helix-turn-helix domain-containing protein [Pseudonocardia sp.]|nr:helix-turn-helix domain-containing protein [Pseudonocardia sp.]
MMQELLTADDVADRLGLHVRTVRNYIRDGRLPAVRVGKQYRIARADLEAFTGLPAETGDPEPATGHLRAEVSSVVEIDAISPATARRVSNLLGSVTTQPRDGDERLHLKMIYDEERANLKIVIVAGLAGSADIFGLIGMVMGETET